MSILRTTPIMGKLISAAIIFIMSYSLAEAAPFAYIRERSGTVTIIDTAIDTVVASVSGVPGGDGGVAIHPSGNFVYVLAEASKEIFVIAAQTNTVIAQIPLPENAFPTAAAIAISRDGKELYVPYEVEGDESGNIIGSAVGIIDTKTLTVIDAIDLGNFATPYGIAIDGERNLLYVTDFLDAAFLSIDLTTRTMVYRSGSSENQMLGEAYDVSVDPSTHKAYIGGCFAVVIFDGLTNSVTGNIPLEGSCEHYGMALHPNGAKAYVSDINGSLFVLDTALKTIETTIPLPGQPYGVAAHPDGSRVYVGNMGADTVSVIDTATNQVISNIPTGRSFGHGLFISPEPSTVSASMFGLTPGAAICRNITTGQAVNIKLNNGRTSWSCEAAGLVVHSGDWIRISAVGSDENATRLINHNVSLTGEGGAVPELKVEGVTITGSNLINQYSSGIGVLGGINDFFVDAGGAEFITFAFDQPVINLGYGSGAYMNGGNLQISAIGTDDLDLGLITPPPHGFSLNISELFANQPITSFTAIPIGSSGRSFSSLFYTSLEPLPVTASVGRLKLQRAGCRNATTRQSVQVPLQNNATGWNCEAAGLVVNPGDVVHVVAVGQVL